MGLFFAILLLIVLAFIVSAAISLSSGRDTYCTGCNRELNFNSRVIFGLGRISNSVELCRHCMRKVRRWSMKTGRKSFETEELAEILLSDTIVEPVSGVITQQSYTGKSGAVWVIYSDASGRDTEREITIRKVEKIYGGYKIYAYCHLKKSIRTFLSDRIEKMVDIDTAEVVDDINAYLKNLSKK